MCFSGADGGKVEFVVEDMARAIPGAQTEVARIGARAEGDDLFGLRIRGVWGGEEGVYEDVERGGSGVCSWGDPS